MTEREEEARHIEANAFAMELLMPEQFLRADLAKMGGIDIGNDADVQRLAKKYRVSVQVMTLRLGELLTSAVSP